jgi:hypothetical protein
MEGGIPMSLGSAFKLLAGGVFEYPKGSRRLDYRGAKGTFQGDAQRRPHPPNTAVGG